MALVVEHAKSGKVGFFASFAPAGTQAGTVLASAVFAVVALVPNEQFLVWGWRLPFLLSAVIVCVAVFVRHNLPESLPDGNKSQTTSRSGLPIMEMLRTELRPLAVATLVYCTIQVGWYLLTIFGITYSVAAGINRSTMLWIVAGAALTAMCMNPVWGALSDRIGRRKVVIGGIAAYCVFVWVYFFAVQSGIVVLVFLSMAAATGLGHAAVNGVTPAFFMESMKVSTRATTAGMAIQIAGVIGGLAPLLATSLAASAGGIWSVALAATGIFLASIVGTLILRRQA
jgi:MFS family permease